MNGKELNEIEEDMKRHNAEYAERVASPFPDTPPLILDTFCTRFEHPTFLKGAVKKVPRKSSQAGDSEAALW